jgi:hypothetical protein
MELPGFPVLEPSSQKLQALPPMQYIWDRRHKNAIWCQPPPDLSQKSRKIMEVAERMAADNTVKLAKVTQAFLREVADDHGIDPALTGSRLDGRNSDTDYFTLRMGRFYPCT